MRTDNSHLRSSDNDILHRQPGRSDAPQRQTRLHRCSPAFWDHAHVRSRPPSFECPALSLLTRHASANTRPYHRDRLGSPSDCKPDLKAELAGCAFGDVSVIQISAEI